MDPIWSNDHPCSAWLAFNEGSLLSLAWQVLDRIPGDFWDLTQKIIKDMHKLEAEAKKRGRNEPHIKRKRKHDSVLHFLEVYGMEFRKKPNRKGKQAVNGDYHGNWRIYIRHHLSHKIKDQTAWKLWWIWWIDACNIFSPITNSHKTVSSPIGSMVLLYMVTWIPSIYPSHVSIYTLANIYQHHGSVMGDVTWG